MPVPPARAALGLGGCLRLRYSPTPSKLAHFFIASVAAPFRSKPRSSGAPLLRDRLIFCDPNCCRVTHLPSTSRSEERRVGKERRSRCELEQKGNNKERGEEVGRA